MKLEFLPAYSPDYNPIEQAFSVLKSKIRREGPIARDGVPNDYGVYEQLYHLVHSITPQDARGFFHNSGYV